MRCPHALRGNKLPQVRASKVNIVPLQWRDQQLRRKPPQKAHIESRNSLIADFINTIDPEQKLSPRQASFFFSGVGLYDYST